MWRSVVLPAIKKVLDLSGHVASDRPDPDQCRRGRAGPVAVTKQVQMRVVPVGGAVGDRMPILTLQLQRGEVV
jgi:hypothetical protein